MTRQDEEGTDKEGWMDLHSISSSQTVLTGLHWSKGPSIPILLVPSVGCWPTMHRYYAECWDIAQHNTAQHRVCAPTDPHTQLGTRQTNKQL
jgi:hypothetical protein